MQLLHDKKNFATEKHKNICGKFGKLTEACLDKGTSDE